jgi:hypothetical protein
LEILKEKAHKVCKKKPHLDISIMHWVDKFWQTQKKSVQRGLLKIRSNS